MSWYVLRICTGHPFRVTDAIGELGIPAFCPRYTIRRRFPRDRSRVLDVTKPLLPGYVFAAEHFDTDRIGPAMLAIAKRKAQSEWLEHRRTIPSLIDCRARWLALEGRPVQMTHDAMTALRESEKAEAMKWRPFADEILHAFREIAKGVKKRSRYVRLEEFHMAVA